MHVLAIITALVVMAITPFLSPPAARESADDAPLSQADADDQA